MLFFLLIVASFFTPDTPGVEDGGAAIAAAIAEDRAGHQWSLLLAFLSDITFLVFLAGLFSRLRRAEGHGGLFSGLVAIAGAVFVSTIMASEGIYLAMVTGTADVGDEPAVFTTLAVLNDWTGSVTLAAGVALFLGVAAGIVSTSALPNWLGWWAAVVCVLLLVSLAGVFQEELEGGVVEYTGFGGFILMMLWTLTTGVVLLVRAGRPATRRQEVAAG
ncbi:hypothetical protein [Blastococcus sp. SYSU D00820]